MISENQVFDANVFLRSYRDALLCIQQTVIKRKTFEQYQFMLVEAQDNKDKNALDVLKFSRYGLFRIFVNKYLKPEPEDSEALLKVLERVKQDSEKFKQG